nr:RNA-directed DNA polymerase, eukaryota [Tanacetum cinerariifolium]
MAKLPNRPQKIQALANRFINRKDRNEQIIVASPEGMYEKTFYEYVEYDSLLGWMTNDWLDGTILHWWCMHRFEMVSKEDFNTCAFFNPTIIEGRVVFGNSSKWTMLEADRQQQQRDPNRDRRRAVDKYIFSREVRIETQQQTTTDSDRTETTDITNQTISDAERGVSVDQAIVEQAVSKIGCTVLKMPFNYLGSKVGSLMSRTMSWNEVLERMVSRLSRWKIKTISIGGRLTLLKSVLGSTPLYHMSMFKVPKKVIQLMETIRSRFFNGADSTTRKHSWVSWKKTMASKDTGGEFSVSSLRKAIDLIHLPQSELIFQEEGGTDRGVKKPDPTPIKPIRVGLRGGAKLLSPDPEARGQLLRRDAPNEASKLLVSL